MILVAGFLCARMLAPASPASQRGVVVATDSVAQPRGLQGLLELPMQAQSAISASLGAADPRFAAHRGSHGWGLAGGGLVASLGDKGGVELRGPGGEWSLAPANGSPSTPRRTERPRQISVRANRVTYSYPGFQQWYAAGPLGIEQGFLLTRRPASDHGFLTLPLAVGGAFRTVRTRGGIVLVGRRPHPAARWARVDGSRGPHMSSVYVPQGRALDPCSDRAAQYPIRVDPIFENSVEMLADCILEFCNGPEGTGEVGGGWTGYSVAISGNRNTILVGAPFDHAGSGAAWMFGLVSGVWTEQRELVGDCGAECGGPSGTGEIGPGEFGWSVALSSDGHTALIGAPHDDLAHRDLLPVHMAPPGCSRVRAAWAQQGRKFVADCIGNSADRVGPAKRPWGISAGASLSGDGSYALIGAPHKTSEMAPLGHSASRAAPGRRPMNFSPTVRAAARAKRLRRDGAGSFGSSVALSTDGNTAAVGAPGDNDEAGAAWTFAQSAGAWSTLGTKLVANCTTAAREMVGPGSRGRFLRRVRRAVGGWKVDPRWRAGQRQLPRRGMAPCARLAGLGPGSSVLRGLHSGVCGGARLRRDRGGPVRSASRSRQWDHSPDRRRRGQQFRRRRLGVLDSQGHAVANERTRRAPRRTAPAPRVPANWRLARSAPART